MAAAREAEATAVAATVADYVVVVMEEVVMAAVSEAVGLEAAARVAGTVEAMVEVARVAAWRVA